MGYRPVQIVFSDNPDRQGVGTAMEAIPRQGEVLKLSGYGDVLVEKVIWWHAPECVGDDGFDHSVTLVVRTDYSAKGIEWIEELHPRNEDWRPEAIIGPAACIYRNEDDDLKDS